ncbi:MAG: V-type ATP synthase subunit F [Candidatus Odinarchaeia archaeon]
MKIIALGDKDTVVGLKLAGIDEGYTPTSIEDAVKYLTQKAYEDKDVGLVIVTEKLGRELRKSVKELFDQPMPIIIEIPDKHGPIKEEDPIRELIKRAIGVEIKLE